MYVIAARSMGQVICSANLDPEYAELHYRHILQIFLKKKKTFKTRRNKRNKRNQKDINKRYQLSK